MANNNTTNIMEAYVSGSSMSPGSPYYYIDEDATLEISINTDHYISILVTSGDFSKYIYNTTNDTFAFTDSEEIFKPPLEISVDITEDFLRNMARRLRIPVTFTCKVYEYVNGKYINVKTEVQTDCDNGIPPMDLFVSTFALQLSQQAMMALERYPEDINNTTLTFTQNNHAFVKNKSHASFSFITPSISHSDVKYCIFYIPSKNDSLDDLCELQDYILNSGYKPYIMNNAGFVKNYVDESFNNFTVDPNFVIYDSSDHAITTGSYFSTENLDKDKPFVVRDYLYECLVLDERTMNEIVELIGSRDINISNNDDSFINILETIRDYANDENDGMNVLFYSAFYFDESLNELADELGITINGPGYEFIPYIEPTCSLRVDRPRAISDKVQLSFSGDFFNDKFGKNSAVEKNQLRIQYRYRPKDSEPDDWNIDWTTIPVINEYDGEITDDDYNFVIGTNSYRSPKPYVITKDGGFNYKESYIFQVRVQDGYFPELINDASKRVLGEEVIVLSEYITEIEVPPGIPVFDYNENDFRFNVPVYMYSQDDYSLAKLDYIVEQGTEDILDSVNSKIGQWFYRKWSSGVAECWGKVSVTTKFENQYGSTGLYVNTNKHGKIKYPLEFIESPMETINMIPSPLPSNNSGGSSDTTNNAIWHYTEKNGTNTKTTTGYYVAIRPSKSSVEQVITAHYDVKGRWK